MSLCLDSFSICAWVLLNKRKLAYLFDYTGCFIMCRFLVFKAQTLTLVTNALGDPGRILPPFHISIS